MCGSQGTYTCMILFLDDSGLRKYYSICNELPVLQSTVYTIHPVNLFLLAAFTFDWVVVLLSVLRQYWKKNRLPELLCKVWYKRYVDIAWLPARTEFNSNWSIGKVISGVIRIFSYRQVHLNILCIFLALFKPS